jgi:hypothetical protein
LGVEEDNRLGCCGCGITLDLVPYNDSLGNIDSTYEAKILTCST